MKRFKNILNSFPVQLLFLNLRQNYVIMVLWTLLFGLVTESVGTRFGIPYLFLDAEYLGHVNFVSFFILGFCMGIFFISVNLSTYVVYGHLFPFMGGLRRPFSRFSINNGMILLIFMVFYLRALIQFQMRDELKTGNEIFILLAGLFLGLAFFAINAYIYFRITSTDVFSLFGFSINLPKPKQKMKKVVMDAHLNWKRVRTRSADWSTTYYLESPWRIKHTSEIPYFDNDILERVITRNQFNAIIIQFIAIFTLVVLGFFSDNPFFQIPAGASLLILFATIVMFSGAVAYWLRGWQLIFWLSIVFVFAFVNKQGWVSDKSAAFGLSYSKNEVYSTERVIASANDSIRRADSLSTITILNEWKRKNALMHQRKPKMILLCASGGGQRAALFTLRFLQLADSSTDGEFLKHTVLISGASGGMLGASYYRDIALANDPTLVGNYGAQLENIGKDALNPIARNMALGGVFSIGETVTIQGKVYEKDRGYALEEALNSNTQHYFKKSLRSYRESEAAAQIPLMFFTPSIINDGRSLYVSPQNISYMCRDANSPITDGIEYRRFFSSCQPDSILMSSIIRMSASFPYITPNVSMPSTPKMVVMDGGLRDNLGGQSAMRFFETFKDWMRENTSGVLFVIVRDTPEQIDIQERGSSSFFGKLFDPLATFYGNWERFQQYNQQSLFMAEQNCTDFPVQQLVFQYLNNSKKNTKASISWHLTSLEKSDVIHSMDNEANREELGRLKAYLR